MKKYCDENVYEATKERLDYIFNEFEEVCVAFSGGKDSGICLNLALDFAKENKLLNKLSVYHLDYEAQYQFTTDYVTETFSNLPKEVKKYWLCLPIKAQCSTSMYQNYWTPWNSEEKELWVRELPKVDYIVTESNCEFNYDDWDYNVQDNFCNWIGKNKKVCVIVGIRSQESLNRHAAITSKNKVNQYNGISWLTNKKDYTVAYLIYDWETEDIWVCNSKFGYTYNKVYDLMFKAGLSVHQMRVASPFNDYAQDSLKLYKVLDPNNWGKMISRVNGVNFTGLYGGTTAMGWKSIKKPSHLTWKEYMYFLLNTLPEDTKQNYLNKLEASKKSWRVGGARDEETIKELLEEKAPVILTGKTNNRSKHKKQVIQFEDYLDDTTVTDFKSIPTYKRMCICIMKNDTTCKYMGFAQTKSEIQKRREAIRKYGEIL